MQHLKLTKNKEELFVEKTFLPLTLNSSFARELKDDVAMIDNLIIKTDSISEGVHVKKKTEGYKMGYKLLARNLSDIASKGGEPTGYTLAIFKNKNISVNFIESFAKGLESFKIPLIGGDVCNSLNHYFCASITIFAKKTAEPPKRSGAKEGDFIYITGKIGRAFLGFKGFKKFKDFYELPVPQNSKMREVFYKHKINSSIDVSDGFLKDLITLLNASNVGGEIEICKILPQNFEKYTKEMLTFGDDYQVIFTSSEEISIDGIIKIGRTKKEKLLTFLDAKDLKFENYGYMI